MHLSWKGALKESSSCLFFFSPKWQSAFMGLLWKFEISLWKLSLQCFSPGFTFLPHESPAPKLPAGVWMSLCRWCRRWFRLYMRGAFPSAWATETAWSVVIHFPEKNVIRINRCFLCLKVFFNLFFKHLAYCIYFDVSQIASLKRYQSFCQLLMLLPFSSSSWQSTIKVVFCYDLQ